MKNSRCKVFRNDMRVLWHAVNDVGSGFTQMCEQRASQDNRAIIQHKTDIIAAKVLPVSRSDARSKRATSW